MRSPWRLHGAPQQRTALGRAAIAIGPRRAGVTIASMSNARTWTLRRAAAGRLRSVAHRLAPEPAGEASSSPRESPALLVRFGGRWWHRDELATLARQEES